MKALMTLILFTFLMACNEELDPCNGAADLEFVEVEGEIRYDDRFGRNIIIAIHTPPPVKIDGTDYYVPCGLSGDLSPGSKITFTGKGERINPDFDAVVAGDAFYTVILSDVKLISD